MTTNKQQADYWAAYTPAYQSLPVGAGPSYNPAYQRAGYYRMVLQWKALAQHQKCNPTAKLKPRKSR